MAPDTLCYSLTLTPVHLPGHVRQRPMVAHEGAERAHKAVVALRVGG